MTPLENGGAISEAELAGAAALLVVVVVVMGVLFHTLILRRMCNYTAEGGRRGLGRDGKQNVCNERVNEEL